MQLSEKDKYHGSHFVARDLIPGLKFNMFCYLHFWDVFNLEQLMIREVKLGKNLKL